MELKRCAISRISTILSSVKTQVSPGKLIKRIADILNVKQGKHKELLAKGGFHAE